MVAEEGREVAAPLVLKIVGGHAVSWASPLMGDVLPERACASEQGPQGVMPIAPRY